MLLVPITRCKEHHMTRSRNLLAAVGVAGLIAAGAAIPAIAQDATDDTATSDDSLEPEAHELRRAARAEAFADALAAELGLEADTVAEAIEAVHEEMQSARQDEIQARVQARLDELVEAGELTQEEADILAEVQGRGVLGGGPGRFGPGGHGRHGGHGVGLGGPLDAPADDTTDVTTDTTSA